MKRMINKKNLILLSLLLLLPLFSGCFSAPSINHAPTITSNEITTATVGVTNTYDINADDPDVGDTLTYSLVTKPAGMVINSTTGLINWTPVSIGDYEITVKVSDGSLFDTRSFTIIVSETPPVPPTPPTPPAPPAPPSPTVVTGVRAISVTYQVSARLELETLKNYKIANINDGLKGETVNSILVRWDAYYEVDGYRVYRKVNNGDYTMIFEWQDPPVASGYGLYDSGISIGNTYSYYVTAYGPNWETSPSEVVTIEITTQTFLPACSLISPTDSSTITEINPVFSWSPVRLDTFNLPYGEVYSGRTILRIYDADTFETAWSVWFDDMTTSTATYNQNGNAGSLIPGHNYRWYVDTYGYDNNGNWVASSDSENWEFYYDGPAIVSRVEAIAITYKGSSMEMFQAKMDKLIEEKLIPDSFHLNELTPTTKGEVEHVIDVNWHSYPDAIGYRVYRSVNGGNYIIILDEEISGYTWYGFWDYDVLEGNTYSYYVVAYGSGWETDPNQTVTIDTWFPPCSLISPTDESIITNPTPTFTWNPVGLASSDFPYGSIALGNSDLYVSDRTGGEIAWWPFFYNDMMISSITYNNDGQALPLENDHTYYWESWGYGFDNSGRFIAMSWSEGWEFSYYGSITPPPPAPPAPPSPPAPPAPPSPPAPPAPPSPPAPPAPPSPPAPPAPPSPPAPPAPPAPPSPPAPPGGSAKWTVMVYIDGDNNLDSYAWDDLSELESVSSTDEINIVAQLDAYYSCSGTFRYYITGSAPGAFYPLYPVDIVQTLSEQNMADPSTLTSFVNWAATNYPAEKYLLVLWNHGGGWREYNILTKGVIWDDTSGDFMTMAELVQGLDGVNEGIDIIGFDACLMQMAEVAYEMNGLTNLPNYMVASQASEWGDGWPYDDILAHLLANPGMTGGTLCETMVDDFINYCGIEGTLSALDFSAGTYDTYTVFDSFVTALMTSSYQNNIATARLLAQSYSYDYKDLYDFAERIKNSVPDCRSEALAVMNQVNDLVLYEAHTGSGVANSHGLSIYLPDNASEYDNDYDDLQFAIDTQWDEFLQGTGGGVVPPSPPPPSSSVYRAFLVGVGDYVYGDNDLSSPPYNVDRMYDTLSHSGSGFSSINELIDLQATKSAILNGIANAFSGADSDDVSYFYYSGHGMPYSGVSYLCPSDASSYLSSFISTNELEATLSAVPGTKVVILGCCHSGGFIGKQIGEEEISNNLQEFNSNVINVFLSRDLTGSQYKVLTSCHSSQVCVELIPEEGDPFGLFSRVLCEGCGYDYYTHPYFADGNGNGEITLHEAYTYTDEQVSIAADYLNTIHPDWNIDQDTQVYPLYSNFVIIEE